MTPRVRRAAVLLVAIAIGVGAPARAHSDTDDSRMRSDAEGRARSDAEGGHAGSDAEGGRARSDAERGRARSDAVGDRGRSDGGALAALIAGLPACDAGRAHCFGIRLHVVVDAAGTVIAKSEWLAAQLAAANRHFARLDVGFEVVGVDALPARAARIATRAERDAVSDGRLVGKVIHVFITGRLDDVDVLDGVIRGVTWHVRGSDRKYVILSTVAPERVLAHELGHVFGLPHSMYAISIMNKTDRAEPPPEQRTFADSEITAMRPVLKRLLRDEVLAEVAR